MKILVALFAFIALSVSVFAQGNATYLPLTVVVQHEAFTCSIVPSTGSSADFGSLTYGDGAVVTNTFEIADTRTIDFTPLKYSWTLTAASTAWSAPSIINTPTYAVTFTTPAIATSPLQDFSAHLDCAVDYLY